MNDPAASGWLWQIIYGVATSIFGGVAGGRRICYVDTQKD